MKTPKNPRLKTVTVTLTVAVEKSLATTDPADAAVHVCEAAKFRYPSGRITGVQVDYWTPEGGESHAYYKDAEDAEACRRPFNA